MRFPLLLCSLTWLRLAAHRQASIHSCYFLLSFFTIAVDVMLAFDRQGKLQNGTTMAS
jgi:hypothetical protein